MKILKLYTPEKYCTKHGYHRDDDKEVGIIKENNWSVMRYSEILNRRAQYNIEYTSYLMVLNHYLLEAITDNAEIDYHLKRKILNDEQTPAEALLALKLS